jgi:hypothetical protein
LCILGTIFLAPLPKVSLAIFKISMMQNFFRKQLLINTNESSSYKHVFTLFSLISLFF